MTDTKYVLIVISEGHPGANVRKGQRFVVVEGEWGPTCSIDLGTYKKPVLFNTIEDAERTARNWIPNPWYVNRESYEILKVRPVYRQVLSGWEKSDE